MEALRLAWDEAFLEYDFGPEHPMSPIRLELAHQLMRDLGLLGHPDVAVVPATAALPRGGRGRLRVGCLGHRRSLGRARTRRSAVCGTQSVGFRQPRPPVPWSVPVAPAMVALAACIPSKTGTSSVPRP